MAQRLKSQKQGNDRYLNEIVIQSILIGNYKPYGSEFANLTKYLESAKIAKEKIYEIWDLFPILKREIIGEGNFGGDYVRLTFRNGSIFDVVSALNSQRGGRRHGGLIDETRKNLKILYIF